MLKSLKIFVFIVLSLFETAASGFAKEVVLPLTLDHQILTALLLQSSFSGSGQGAEIFGQPGDCTYVRLSAPQFSSAGKLLRLEMRLDIRAGSRLGDSCLVPIEWHGYLELLQKPVLNGETFSLSFHTVDSRLLTLSREPATIAGMLWTFAKPRVYEHLERVRLDLAPPIAELRSFLGPLFPRQNEQVTRAMLDSLHGGQVLVGKEAVVVELLTEVTEAFNGGDNEPDAALTIEDRQRMVQLWETWDAFLVRLLETMAKEPLLPEDRQILIDVLFDTRYVFITALDQQEVRRDFVRLQFVRAWKQLAPVFRRQLFLQASDNSLGYLAFFTAVDALEVLDRMGPTFGIEISEQGLLRLAEMLSGKNTSLPYGTQVDKQLRELLELPQVDQDVQPQDNREEIELEEEKQTPEALLRLFNFLAAPVYGAEPTSMAEILRWKPPGADIDAYVVRVRKVLAESVDSLLKRGAIPAKFHGMFMDLIPAMAWQESCFRQFVIKKNKLTYLLSYNQSSVGLMQINERVWRGLYDRNRLRWDIHYNAYAGCEIAGLYLRKYALKNPVWEKGGDQTLLARVLYAMYNGGPGQYEKFLDRAGKNQHYQSDQLFFEKLQWVVKGQWGNVNLCLVGGS